MSMGQSISCALCSAAAITLRASSSVMVSIASLSLSVKRIHLY
jgi:hypothetical protein